MSDNPDDATGPAPEQARTLVDRALDELRAQRPVFYSEADLQHHLAWQMHLLRPDGRIRLEVPLLAGGREYLDLFVEVDGLRLGIELKYPRAPFYAEVDGEPTPFSRKNADAVDDTRYAISGDLKRLERLVAEERADVGCLVAVTNNAAYWTPPVKPVVALDAAFRIHDGSVLAGELVWAPGGRAKGSITLRGRYAIEWRDFSALPSDAHGATAFRYLTLWVK